MSLFELGDFTLHSGERSEWIINCHELSNGDLQALARMAHKLLPAFHAVVGIPRGGLRFAEALRPYTDASGTLLIADDVFTTGSSMEEELCRAGRRYGGVMGVVIFARRDTPKWITPLFTAAT